MKQKQRKFDTKDKIAICLGYLGVIIGIILLIHNTEALYAGENETITLLSEIVNCSVINSTYNLDGLNLSWNNKDIIIKTELGYHPDNLTISCWTIEQKEVITHLSGGGGYCIEKTNCTEWSECLGNNQVQFCSTKSKLCKVTTERKEQSCGVVEKNETQILNETIEEYMPTKKQSNLILWIIGGGLLLLLIGIMYWFLHGRKEEVQDDIIPIQVQNFPKETAEGEVK